MKIKISNILLTLSILSLFSCNTSENKIDRKAVVDRHKIITIEDNPQSPAQAGNGEFAFGVDITGLQTFTAHYTMSHWSWHSFPLPEELNINDFEGKLWNTYGRPVRYDDWNDDQPELLAWLAGNPHMFNMGRIGYVLKKVNGSPATLTDLKNKKTRNRSVDGGPFPYFPSNGALLTAIGMMTAGWEGSTGKTPGFPKNGQ